MVSADLGVLDVAALAPDALEVIARDLDRERCRHEVALAVYVHKVYESCAFVADGHRTVAAWGRAACNWSRGEAARIVRLGALLARFPSALAAAEEGRIGLPQLHALASVVTNPRVQAHVDESEEFLVGQGTELDFDDYAAALAAWESAADEDGAHRDHERSHRNRRASATVVGHQFFLDASGGATQGAQMVEILRAFAHSEWLADWEAGARHYGEAMNTGLMDRTDAQRRFDALFAIFVKAAALATDDTGATLPTLNILVGQATFEHHLEKALGGNPAPLDPCDPHNRCETEHGVQIDPQDMIVAALVGSVRRMVLDAAGVVIDFGRKQRLFTGALREAILLSNRRCTWGGCCRPGSECEADHLLPWSHAGPTSSSNGGPACNHHNRFRTRGYRTWRDEKGHWRHARPDGTEIGWRAAQPAAS